jgi:Glycosyl transferases group 1
VADRKRIAFVKFGGLAAGGTERWLQTMAANLPRERFAIDYLYCDTAPYIGSDFQHPDTDPARLRYMRQAGVNLVKFSVGAKDVTTPTHDWVDTDFWEIFDPQAYDLVQTAKAGHAEYPYCHMKIPVVECVTLDAGTDRSRNVVLSILLSQRQRRTWTGTGGKLQRSLIIPIPAEEPASMVDLRDELGIPRDSDVAGFHQRAQNEIHSPIPLNAFCAVFRPERYFLIMGGGSLYRRQAAELGLRNVIFLEHHGAAVEISKFLNTLDVFAHGRADGETFGTVFAEAMMHGKPCLSHRSPISNAQPETMGPAGLFATDAQDYATKLDQLFTDRELYDRLASKAVRHAQRYYSIESCVRRLEHAYETLLSDPSGPTRTAMPPMATPYGQSDLGFLVAGAIEDPTSVAHHVATGEIPDEPVVDLLRNLVGPESVYHEVGSANTILALAVSTGDHALPRHLHASADAHVEAARASIELNNWEERLVLRVVRDAADIPAEQLREADVIAVNASEWTVPILDRLTLDSSEQRPAFLISASPGDRRALSSSLRALGYDCHRVRDHSIPVQLRRRGQPSWLICLHRTRHETLVTLHSAWVERRRRERRQRLRSFPGRAWASVTDRTRLLLPLIRRSLRC